MTNKLRLRGPNNYLSNQSEGARWVPPPTLAGLVARVRALFWRKMHIIVWDLEIATPIKNNDWEAAKRGENGISSLVCYDNVSERYHLYDDFTFPQCVEHLNSADLLVGFNSLEFDTPCFQGYTGCTLVPPQFDILQAVWQALGSRKSGWKLDAIAQRTINEGKSGTGESAPKLYAEGRFGELFDYNLNDVYITRKLYNHIVSFGTLTRPDGKPLQLIEYPDVRA